MLGGAPPSRASPGRQSHHTRSPGVGLCISLLEASDSSAWDELLLLRVFFWGLASRLFRRFLSFGKGAVVAPSLHAGDEQAHRSGANHLDRNRVSTNSMHEGPGVYSRAHWVH